MNPLQNKKIILGITGSIAAYKGADLASKLHQAGAQVNVILTEAATRFINPISFESVTATKAFIDSDLWGGEGHVIHVGLGHTADLMVIAPATANTIAKLANGIGDNLLTVTALAARCPLVIAPALDVGMYAHPATQENVKKLQERGVIFIGPDKGHLASGLTGLGRFVEPLEIIGHLRKITAQGGPLSGKKVIVTAGGTQEIIDPVRVITNRSSGKQGIAVAQAAIDAGADVSLFYGSIQTSLPYGCQCFKFQTAAELQAALIEQLPGSHALIMAAAVADFRPKNAASQKIKKEHGIESIFLEPTDDILLAVSQVKTANHYPKFIIGFAAESDNLITNATKKVTTKKLDMIVANDISAPDAGFSVDTNRVSLIFHDGKLEHLPLMSKSEVAEAIIERLIQLDK